MSNAVATKTNGSVQAADEPMSIAFVPFGERSEIKLSPGIIRKFLATPTAAGAMPDDATIVKFMMLCKARELNPFAGDAWLIGYDGKGGPEFSCITAHQALLKRAEACSAYNGMQSGVIVRPKDSSEPINREGDFLHDGDTLLGAWAIVYRKDRDFPSTDRLNVTTFDKAYSQWKTNRAGMIVKCAEASALRKAFPTQLGALYTSDEYERFGDATMVLDGTPRLSPVSPQTLNQLVDQRKAKVEQAEHPAEQPADMAADGEIPVDEVVESDAAVTLAMVKAEIAKATSVAQVQHIRGEYCGPDGGFTSSESDLIDSLCAARIEALKSPRGKTGTMFDKGQPTPE